MTVTWTAFALLAALGIGAGAIGALAGIGGGVIVVPVLVLGFGYDIRVAVATSLVAVVATSSAAGAAVAGEGYANLRLGMTLEVATTLGSLAGGLIAVSISPSVVSGLFAMIMVVTSALILRRPAHGDSPDPATAMAVSGSPAAARPVGRLDGEFVNPATGEVVAYRTERLLFGSSISAVAGLLSGMLGVGGGFLKVPALNLAMRVPLRVATATSNFMVGVTALASLTVYFTRGYVHPLVVAPVVVGIAVGAVAGTRLSARISNTLLRNALAVILAAVAIQMGLRAFGIGSTS